MAGEIHRRRRRYSRVPKRSFLAVDVRKRDSSVGVGRPVAGQQESRKMHWREIAARQATASEGNSMSLLFMQTSSRRKRRVPEWLLGLMSLCLRGGKVSFDGGRRGFDQGRMDIA
jgi:hypothetical protein